LTTANIELQNWLLVCALFAHPADQLPFPDLIRLPELFPFRFTLTLDGLRKDEQLTIQKQGMWDMISIKR
jgi:hypothetical protein